MRACYDPAFLIPGSRAPLSSYPHTPQNLERKAPFAFHHSTIRSDRHDLSSMYPEQPTITTAKGTRFKTRGDLYHPGSDQRRANHARVVAELSANDLNISARRWQRLTASVVFGDAEEEIDGLDHTSTENNALRIEQVDRRSQP